jgi:electron transport complex protein RnfB
MILAFDIGAFLTPLFILGLMGLLLGLGLAFAADVFKVEVDERVEKVIELLPGYNCGACGYPGCAGFGEAVVEGEVTQLSMCKPGKDEHYNAIIEYLKNTPGPDGNTMDVKK